MSDLMGVLPPIPSNFDNSLDSSSTGSGAFSASSLAGDLAQMQSGAVPGMPSGTSATGSTSSTGTTTLSGLMASLANQISGGSGLSSSTTSPSSTTSNTLSSLTSFTASSLIGRVLFFLLGLMFMAGAVYTYKK